MNMNNIETKIRAIIEENAEMQKDFSHITSDIDLKNIGINSITFIKIVVSIETEFGIEFEDEDLDYNKFPNIKSLVNYVEDKTHNSKESK